MSCTSFSSTKSAIIQDNGVSTEVENASDAALATLARKEKNEEVRKKRLESSFVQVKTRLTDCTEVLSKEKTVFEELGSESKMLIKSSNISGMVFSLSAATVLFYATQDLIITLVFTILFVSYIYISRLPMISFERKQSGTISSIKLLEEHITRLNEAIFRAELVLKQDIVDVDSDWEKTEAESRKKWEEERHRAELSLMEHAQSRLKNFHPDLLKREHVMPQYSANAGSVSDLRANMKKQKTGGGGGRSFRTLFSSFREMDVDSISMMTEEVPDELPAFDPEATAQWKAYVSLIMPLERLSTMSEPEKHFSKLLREKSQGKWDQIPLDLKLMALRAWEDRKDRLEFTVEQVEYISNWRKTCSADQMLKTHTTEEERFFNSWFTRVGGQDVYGHPIIFDRVSDFDLDYLFTLSDDQVLTFHTKQMEVLRNLKLDFSKSRKQRICKHIYILDLQGLSVEGTAYPDSLWSLYLVNCPLTFRIVWQALSPTIDPNSKAKIRMKGNSSDYIPEMKSCGIPIESIPKEFGGQYQSVSYFDLLKKYVEQHSTVRN